MLMLKIENEVSTTFNINKLLDSVQTLQLQAFTTALMLHKRKAV